jgi:D-inositol-3-phosphate glycosyltransferase
MSLSIAMLSVHTSPLDRPGYTKDAGGMNVYIRALARELGQRHVTVDIFTRSTSEQTLRIVPISPRVRVIHIKAGPVAPVHKNELYDFLPAFERHIDQFRRAEGKTYDLVHSHYWLSGVAAMQLAAQWDIPHVTMFHTLARLKQLAHPDEPEPPLRLFMEQRIIQRADGIIAATAGERTQLMRLCGALSGQLHVIPCGVDLRLFTPRDRRQARVALGLDSDRPVLLFAGRLDPFKGADILLRAAALMEEDAEIVLVGGNLRQDSDLEQLRQLAAELQIERRVRFLGAQPQEAMPSIYSAADVTVVPSYHESFGLVAVESLACGTPVVATRSGGLATVVHHGETGYLVPRCPGFFAERLDALLRDQDSWQRMSQAARPSVLQYNWANVAAQVQSVYENLIEAWEEIPVNY